MKVLTHIAGSTCVVMFDNGDYIDAKRYAHRKEQEHIEVVVNGQVREHVSAHVDRAPGTIIRLVKKHFPFRCCTYSNKGGQ